MPADRAQLPDLLPMAARHPHRLDLGIAMVRDGELAVALIVDLEDAIELPREGLPELVDALIECAAAIGVDLELGR